MTKPTKAVFLSYASQDAKVARHICEALRATGIEVWFDQSELRGGDAWDHKIRQQIRDCALFIPVISANTAWRHEGYFRLEWDLADKRTQMIARDRAFIVPVCIDGTPDSVTDVPESFSRVQWTLLPAGETPPGFVQRVSTLLLPGAHVASAPAQLPTVSLPSAPATSRWRLTSLLIVAFAVIGLIYFAVGRFVLSGRVAGTRQASARTAQVVAPAESTVAEKSIAVLPFVDMSEKRDQEYFSDGLTEELIDHLAHAADLKVIARTSSFKFKGKSDDVRVIASVLGVAHLLEGSVRKSGNTLRITAQLIKAADGTHIWSQTYDRNLDNIFKVQDEIASTVAGALNVILNAGSSRVEVGSASIEAYNLTLKGNYLRSRFTIHDMERAIDSYQDAIRRDPNYALAWAQLAMAHSYQGNIGWRPRAQAYAEAREAAQRSLRIDPNLVGGHYALANLHMRVDRDWAAARAEIDRMREIDPGNSTWIPLAVAGLASIFGQLEEAITIWEHQLDRDPLNIEIMDHLVNYYFAADRVQDAAAMSRRIIELNPSFPGCQTCLAVFLVFQNHAPEALAVIAKEPHEGVRLTFLPLVYWAAGRRDDSNAALDTAKHRYGDTFPYWIACVYAYRGDVDAAFDWLDRAYRQSDPYLSDFQSDPLLRNLHKDPRFRAFIRKMNLPE
jgi:TolB-like protein